MHRLGKVGSAMPCAALPYSSRPGHIVQRTHFPIFSVSIKQRNHELDQFRFPCNRVSSTTHALKTPVCVGGNSIEVLSISKEKKQSMCCVHVGNGALDVKLASMSHFNFAGLGPFFFIRLPKQLDC